MIAVASLSSWLLLIPVGRTGRWALCVVVVSRFLHAAQDGQQQETGKRESRRDEDERSQ